VKMRQELKARPKVVKEQDYDDFGTYHEENGIQFDG